MHKNEIRDLVLNILLFAVVTANIIYFISFYVKPSKYINENRDDRRKADILKLKNAVDLYIADGQDLNVLEQGKAYTSAPALTAINGKGWLPLNLKTISSGSPFKDLPIDPLNDTTYFYRIGVDVANQTFEIDCRFEDEINQAKSKSDKGNNSDWYEVGTDLTILN
jgi:hypothetical protein